MTPDELFRDIPHEVLREGDGRAITSVVIDSRKVGDGCLFVCLRGLKVDGHGFASEVAEKGAAALLVDRASDDYPAGLRVVRVDDTRKALSPLAANCCGRPADALRLFGVTGTNGKTTVTYFLEAILRQTGSVGLIGTLGARLDGVAADIPYETSTTPDPPELQRILAYMRDGGASDVVMEVSSHALALYKLAGIRFAVGVFTNITQDHLDFHGTMDNYLEAKTRLFGQCASGVINADDARAASVMASARCNWLTYGIENACDLRASNIEQLTDGSSFDVEIDGKEERFSIPARGRFNVYNALAAIGAALAAGVPITHIKNGLARAPGVPGRIQSVQNRKGAHVLVDYAHSPDGLANIINAVRDFTKGRVITLFGCGGDRDAAKRPIMGRVAGELSDYCIVTSDNPRSEAPDEIIRQIVAGLSETSCPFETLPDRRAAIFRGAAMAGAGDALIIAGKGHERTQIIGGEVLPFDDVEVAREALSE
uniref:UDP-N-acetylmuramoyl-L-alanyl-D-glutamate--2,6-diaminopimelate ligase n=1 Tax=uncultured bacterium contig00034 TaxID=1181523 RepID=A0A806JYP4_9BACT|nr:UDP-N-acetylmuramoylalanyl-D-glutamate--2,6-diaminopimelate ligase [uncultured bacterium contig00034]